MMMNATATATASATASATATATNETRFCDLKDFSVSYRSMHGYLSIIVCVLGSVTNVLNICVLTRKEMRVPTNFILTTLALCDLAVMLDYVPFAMHTYLTVRTIPDYFSYPWAIYMFFHALFTLACHFNSCCLTVMLAIWRYIAINIPQQNKVWCSHQRTVVTIVLIVCVLGPLLCTTAFFSLQINVAERHTHPNGTLIAEDQWRKFVNLPGYSNVTANIFYLGAKRGSESMNFIIYSVVLKLLPCIFLTVLSILLIKSLCDAKKRWQNLSHNSGVPLVGADHNKQRRIMEKEQQADRTTKMLLAVLLLFLITELPQATMGLLSALLGNKFMMACYHPLGDIYDITALINSSITFILYCSMSQQFRCTFNKFFANFWCFRSKTSTMLNAEIDTKTSHV